MQKKNWKAWLYLLPAIAFLGVFMVYPLIDVFVSSGAQGSITIPMCCTIPISCRR